MNMNIKSLICLMPVAIFASCSQAQPASQTPEWKATVKVVDEAGQPIAGADVTIGYYVPPPPGESIASSSKRGKTDTNGVFHASEKSTSSDLFFGAGKDDYYRAHLDYELGLPIEYDPVKWSPSVTLLLKKIRHPIAMYAKRIEKGPPIFNESVGYDFVVGDWVAPHGKGQNDDIIFRGDLERRSPEDFDYKLTVSFPRNGDGLQEFAVSSLESGSALRSPHEAPSTQYQPEIIRTMSRHPGQGTKDDSNKERNYFIRVRTVLDEHGNVKSAHYGKIYGDFMRFRYYLNPTPNDRNVEFDPKRNLLKGLNSLERVDAP